MGLVDKTFEVPSRPFGRQEGNILLQRLPGHLQDLLGPLIRRRKLRTGYALRERQSPLNSVSFIRKGLVSIEGFDPEGRDVGVALVGREGAVGVSLVFGGSAVMWSAKAITECSVDEIDANEFLSLCQEHPVLFQAMKEYECERLSQIMTFSALGAKLRLKERLSAWLLAATDRLEADSIEITHLHLSRLLGVRRASVTEALHVLEGEGVVISRRWQLIVRDRKKLESAAPLSCRCRRFQSAVISSHGDPAA